MSGSIYLDHNATTQAAPEVVAEMVAAMHAKGTALKTAPFLSIDDVIDPMDTRHWVANGLRSVAGRTRADHPRRIDCW